MKHQPARFAASSWLAFGVDRQKDGGRCGGWQSRQSPEMRELFIAMRRRWRTASCQRRKGRLL
jgi:hypothetical protein